MAPLAVLAIALAVVALGAAAMAGVQALRGVRTLREAVTAATGRISPLVTDLQAELAVLSTEAEAVSAAAARVRAPHLPRRPTPRGQRRPTRAWGSSRLGALRRR